MGQETKNRVLIMWSLTLLIIKIRLLEWQFFWIVRNCFFSLRQQQYHSIEITELLSKKCQELSSVQYIKWLQGDLNSPFRNTMMSFVNHNNRSQQKGIQNIVKKFYLNTTTAKGYEAGGQIGFGPNTPSIAILFLVLHKKWPNSYQDFGLTSDHLAVSKYRKNIISPTILLRSVLISK